ncbi:MAG: ribose-5-phosphate isomerase RpiA [Chitinophagaceae bacterium]
MSSINPGKKAAGEKATEYIQSGMIVGLGTGSTAFWSIEKIGKMVAGGLQIKAIATSNQSEKQAKNLHIPLISFSELDHIDVDIDGADEVDENLNLIKGGGGALLREKIIASSSRKMIVVVDESKMVKTLGKFPLPVEVIPFGWEMTFRKLRSFGCTPVLRKKNDQVFVTDNGNYIIDCSFGSISAPDDLHSKINNIPGVVENGLFANMCNAVIVGYEDGNTKEILRNV